VSFYTNLFLATGTGSALDYWNSQSYGNVSLANSIVTPYWQNTGQTQAWHLSQGRATNIQTCVNSVQNAYNFSSFYNFVAIYNFKIDEGATGVTIGGRGVTGVIIDRDSPETGLLHEMGHGFGLPHSFNDQGIEYGDPYDLMSAMNVDSYGGNYCVPPGSWYGCDNGPGLNAFTRAQLGWLPVQRQMWWSASAGTRTTANVTLAARNESPGALPQILYVPASPTFMYTVEWADADNYDQGISQNTLLIHKINSGDQRTFLVTSSGGTQTAPGNPFYDNASGVHIALTGTQGTPATATVQVTACTPFTCSDLGAQCGSIGDGCGGTLSCGTCATGNSCSLNMCCHNGTSWSTVTNSCSAHPLVCKSGFGDCGGYCCKCGPDQPC
jgi:hypothetical protein